jgi:hypothetical protein
MLRSAYYIGEVLYRGTRYEGNHEQIIERATWERVQTVLAAHNTAGDRQRVHEHYLKGSVFCGECGSRLMVSIAKNAQGVTYDYFVCLGRHRKRTNCTRQAMRVDNVESAVASAWSKLKLTYSERLEAKATIQKELEQLGQREGRDRQAFEAQRDALLGERTKLLAAHYADAIPIDLLKLEQDRIARSLEIVSEQLSLLTTDQTSLLDNLDAILNLLQNCDDAYRLASPSTRRLMNQAFADRIFIDEAGDGFIHAVDVVQSVSNVVAIHSRGKLAQSEEEPPPASTKAEPANELHNTKSRSVSASGLCVVASKRLFAGRSLNKPFWVDPRRFELLTSSMRTRRATNCAKGPFTA